MRDIGNQYVSRIRCLLKARCHVRRIANRGVVHSEVASNAANDDQTGVDALSHLEIDSSSPLNVRPVTFQRRPDAQSRVYGALGMVLMRDGSTEQSHDTVAEKLVNCPLIPMDLVQHKLECAIH
jgi:hypothetical protein